MDFRQLEYFAAIADLGSYSAAAAHLHISQPALSKSIAALEAELKVPLFTRLSRGVVLTGPGRLLRASTEQIDREVRNAKAVVQATADLEKGELELACLASATVEAAADLIGRFHQAHPGVQIKLFEPDQDHDVRRLVSSGRCEIGFTDLDVAENSEFATTSLGQHRLLLVLPPGTPAPESRMPLSQLAQLDLVMGPPGTPARDLVENVLTRLGLRARISVQVNRRDPIEHLVLASAGSTLLPEKLAKSCAARGASVVETEPPIFREFKMITRRGTLSPAARAFTKLTVTPPEPSASSQ